MDGMQITLLIMGAMVFIVSFLLPGGKAGKGGGASDGSTTMTEDQIKFMVEKEIDDAKQHINDIIDETITYAMEKTERSMDRVTNEKMLAINEYSDTVLNEINKNQQEVVFLYDMLNDKHETLKNTVSQATITASEVKQTVRDAEVTAKEAEETAKAVRDQLFTPFQAERMESIQPEWGGNAQPEWAGLNAPEWTDNNQSGQAEDNPLGQTENMPLGRMESSQPAWVEIFQPERIESVGTELGKDMPPEDGEPIKSSRTPEKKPERSSRKTGSAAAAMAGRTEPDGNGITDSTPRKMEVLFKGSRNGGRNNNERILELHKAGKSNMAIAKDLGLGIGEVKLVIDLFEGAN